MYRDVAIVTLSNIHECVHKRLQYLDKITDGLNHSKNYKGKKPVNNKNDKIDIKNIFIFYLIQFKLISRKKPMAMLSPYSIFYVFYQILKN